MTMNSFAVSSAITTNLFRFDIAFSKRLAPIRFAVRTASGSRNVRLT
jgi:hypothetical protein